LKANKKKQDSGYNFIDPIDVEYIDEEEAPMTQRSRVAKLLGYSTVFYKFAAGK
jgi:hypothetical protein